MCKIYFGLSPHPLWWPLDESHNMVRAMYSRVVVVVVFPWCNLKYLTFGK